MSSPPLMKTPKSQLTADKKNLSLPKKIFYTQRQRSHNETPEEQRSQTQKIRQNEMQRNMFQMKEQDKTPEEQLSEVEIGKLPEKEFRVMIVKMT